MTRVCHNFCILIQSTLSCFQWRSLPFLLSALEFRITDVKKVNSVLHGINRNGVSITDKGDGPADLGLRNNMANYEPMGAVQMC